MGETLTRNAQLVKFFAQQYSGIPRKRLVKLVYLVDILGRQFLGHPLSDLSYRLDKFGPYDAAIEDAVQELVEAGLAREDESFDQGFVWRRLRDVGMAVTFSFTLGENEILAYVAANYLNLPMSELLDDVVYETAPMKAAETFRGPLPMHLVDNVGRKAVGFDLEAVMRAERQAEEGHYATLGTYFDGLRARIAAGHAKPD